MYFHYLIILAISYRFLGFYYDSSGQLRSTSNEEKDILKVQAKIVSTTISGSRGCIFIDFDLDGDLQVVDCGDAYPYICAQPAGNYKRSNS